MRASITVIIPAYNAGRWINDALLSVRAQEGVETEIIVVDDGSTDDTRSIVGAHAGVKYIYKQNGGQATARNLGIRHASTKYIAFLDADDVWLPAKTKLQLAEMEKFQAKWSFSDALVADAHSGIVLYHYNKAKNIGPNSVYKKLTLENIIPSPSVIVDRLVFQEVGEFDERQELRNREDWDMWLRLAERHIPIYIPKPLAIYRLHDNNSTRVEVVTAALDSALTVIELARRRRPRCAPALFRKSEALQYLHASRLYRRARVLRPAVYMAIRAIATQPRMFKAYVGLIWSLVPIAIGKKIKSLLLK